MPRTTKAKSSKSARPAPITYGVHPGVAMVMKWVAELKEKTGRTLEEWCALIQKEGPKEIAARREWLKTKFKLGTNTVWWLAERADGQPTWDESPEAYLAIAPTYVDEMFGGSKAALRPLGDALMLLGHEVAADIKFCPCKTIIPFYRDHVIAQINPATRTRIDFGFSLGLDVPFTARLKDTGGIKKKDRITHKVEITKMEDIDKDVKKWLRAAYDRDA
ncbi:MAG TPA: DUF5655 domain-containing protein [Gemmataceae bacterium]|nr:DUF5655 domain-containing protein [Gemmataceae bacterium]